MTAWAEAVKRRLCDLMGHDDQPCGPWRKAYAFQMRAWERDRACVRCGKRWIEWRTAS